MATPPANNPPATVWQAFISDVNQAEDDPETLIAYSIYKSDIFATYNQGIADGKTQAQIDAEIDLIKRFTRTDFNYRNTFRVRATRFVTRYEKATEKKIIADLWNKIEQQNVERVGLLKKFGIGLWNGLMSIIATTIMVALITGLSSIFVSPETRAKIATAGIKSAVSALYGEIPLLDNLTGDSKEPPKPTKTP